MSFRIVIRTRNRWIYWNQTFLGLVMPNSAWHNINKKSWNIMIKLGGHVLRSPGRSTWSLWSWSRCQMKNTLEIFIISKDRVLSLINCPFTSRRILQTLRMWFSGSNFGRSLPYKYSRQREIKVAWYRSCIQPQQVGLHQCKNAESRNIQDKTIYHPFD